MGPATAEESPAEYGQIPTIATSLLLLTHGRHKVLLCFEPFFKSDMHTTPLAC